MQAHDLLIDPALHTPIVQQIVDQVQAGIACGRLPAGDSLPSVRAVASVHRIHAMTVSTAYQRLVALGMLERRRGAVLRVRSVPAMSAAERLQRLDQQLHQALRLAHDLGIEPAAVLARMDSLMSASARHAEQRSLESRSDAAQAL
jgi:DNA-binding transcriptional regulator YhcF (GntR family)